MKLNLKSPMAFFDLETTGVNVSTDRVVEISILKVMPDGTEEVLTKRVNPEMPIPKEVTAIHGISDEDVANEPTFKTMAAEINGFLKGCDLAGYNCNRFDIPVLIEEFMRADIDFDITDRKIVDVQAIFHKKERRTLEAAYKFYCDKELENAHSAEADIRATYEVLKGQLDRYEDIENDTEFLHEFTSAGSRVDLMGRFVYDDKGVELFNFGKHRGKKVTDVLTKEPSYYSWMMNGEFPHNTKQALKKIKEKMGADNSRKNTLFDHL